MRVYGGNGILISGAEFILNIAGDACSWVLWFMRDLLWVRVGAVRKEEQHRLWAKLVLPFGQIWLTGKRFVSPGVEVFVQRLLSWARSFLGDVSWMADFCLLLPAAFSFQEKECSSHWHTLWCAHGTYDLVELYSSTYLSQLWVPRRSVTKKTW